MGCPSDPSEQRCRETVLPAPESKSCLRQPSCLSQRPGPEWPKSRSDCSYAPRFPSPGSPSTVATRSMAVSQLSGLTKRSLSQATQAKPRIGCRLVFITLPRVRSRTALPPTGESAPLRVPPRSFTSRLRPATCPLRSYPLVPSSKGRVRITSLPVKRYFGKSFLMHPGASLEAACNLLWGRIDFAQRAQGLPSIFSFSEVLPRVSLR